MKRKEFMKLFYEDWLEGTDGLTLEQEGAYLRIVIAIYKRGKPLPNRPVTIRHMLRKSKKWTEDTIAFLISEGKLKIDQDGCTRRQDGRVPCAERPERSSCLARRGKGQRGRRERGAVADQGHLQVLRISRCRRTCHVYDRRIA